MERYLHKIGTVRCNCYCFMRLLKVSGTVTSTQNAIMQNSVCGKRSHSETHCTFPVLHIVGIFKVQLNTNL
jgi:hypothetical protein